MVFGPHLPVAIIVQVRMGATRLPGKPLLKVIGKPLIYYLAERLKQSKLNLPLIFATSTNQKDDPLVEALDQQKLKVFRGSEEDVLSRYYQAATQFNIETIIRITGDCPLIDPDLIDQAVSVFVKSSYDYYSNTIKRTYPRGMDIEIFSYSALKKAYENSTQLTEKEHVTPYIYRHPELFQLGEMLNIGDSSSYRLTVDTPEDFELIRRILGRLYPKNPQFRLVDILKLLHQEPEWVKINQHIEQKKI